MKNLLVVIIPLGLLVAACSKEESSSAGRPSPSESSRVAITVSEEGFEPDPIKVAAGKPVTLVFTRNTDQTCAKEIVTTMADGTKIDRKLPLDTPSSSPLRSEVGHALVRLRHGHDERHDRGRVAITRSRARRYWAVLGGDALLRKVAAPLAILAADRSIGLSRKRGRVAGLTGLRSRPPRHQGRDRQDREDDHQRDGTGNVHEIVREHLQRDEAEDRGEASVHEAKPREPACDREVNRPQPEYRHRVRREHDERIGRHAEYRGHRVDRERDIGDLERDQTHEQRGCKELPRRRLANHEVSAVELWCRA